MVRAAVLLVWGLSAFACGSASQGPPPVAARVVDPPLSLPEGGATLRLEQRARAELPGSKGAFTVELGDITGARTQLVVARKDGGGVLASQSVAQGDRVPLLLEGNGYELVIERLHDGMLSGDWLELRVRASGATTSPPAVVDERARIEGLLAAVEHSGVVFIRNGSEHDARAAADHLRTKWSRAGDGIDTAEAFIDRLGTRSSQSGEAYRVRLPDGTEREAGPWLHEQLAALAPS